MIEMFKTISGCDNDVMAAYFIDKAKDDIKAYTKRNTHTIENNLKTQVINLATVYYNQRGAEGLQSQSYSGVSEHYVEGIPQNIRNVLNSYRYLVQEEEVTP